MLYQNLNLKCNLFETKDGIKISIVFPLAESQIFIFFDIEQILNLKVKDKQLIKGSATLDKDSATSEGMEVLATFSQDNQAKQALEDLQNLYLKIVEFNGLEFLDTNKSKLDKNKQENDFKENRWLKVFLQPIFFVIIILLTFFLGVIFQKNNSLEKPIKKEKITITKPTNDTPQSSQNLEPNKNLTNNQISNNTTLPNFNNNLYQSFLPNNTLNQNILDPNTANMPIFKVEELKKLNSFKIGKNPDQLYVFSDPTCPACKDLDRILKEQKISYTLIPIGVRTTQSPLYAAQVYCANEPLKAWNDILNGGQHVPENTDKDYLTKCSNLSIDNLKYFLEHKFNDNPTLKGTPILIKSNGQASIGFSDNTQELLNWLNNK